VIALARDNGFALVVVISGISNPLLNQGVRRLRKDLTAAEPNGWSFFVNPGKDGQDLSLIESVRDNWADPETPRALKKTAVCILLKHYGRIDALREIVERFGWSGLRVLIIDDEADQASLNTSFRRGKESATYRNIRLLRDVFPHHAYLQYTATPQAPLLLAIADVLSPDFVHVLEPGDEYVGGPEFFGSARGLVRVIPDDDLLMADDPDGPPPPSLVTAFQEFLVGAAHVLATGQVETRSLLVHPSRLTDPHVLFYRWVRALWGHWKGAIDEPEEAHFLKDQFEGAWQSLKNSDPSLAGFDECWAALRYVLRNLQVIEMNARDSQTPVIEWDSSKAYVLVGGQALDRGFTVDGLAVTYMSRDPGSWTADTIQQRARFFGYKRHYLQQCRVYLEPALRDAFDMYVEHERHMLASLREIAGGETSLKEWERNFLLAPSMRATRQSVVSLPMIAVTAGERWIYDPLPHVVQAEVAQSVEALDRYSVFDSPPDAHGHLWGTMSLEGLLRVAEEAEVISAVESADFRALRLQIARLLDEHPLEQVTVIKMRWPVEGVRTLTTSGTVQPFQGASSGYLGDRKIFDEANLTVQIHRLALRRSKFEQPFASVLTIAFRTPERLAASWLIEDEAE